MSAPEDSNSKAPPSLLSGASPERGANHSRILANLEGRVSPSTDTAAPRSRKTPLALLAVLVVAIGGWGVWRVQQHAGSGAEVATAASAASASASTVAKAASSVAASAPVVVAQEASAPQVATIVNDDSVASDAKVAAPTGDRLSRALANGASDVSPSDAAAAAGVAATAAATAKAAHATRSAQAKPEAKPAKETKAELAARKRHEKAQQTELAQAKKARQAGSRTASKDDPDADLLAALVARTKPAEPKANATAKANAAKVSTAAADTTLAAKVKECSQRGFFEDQLCRWRVCDGHWGKDPACPTAATPKQP